MLNHRFLTLYNSLFSSQKPKAIKVFYAILSTNYEHNFILYQLCFLSDKVDFFMFLIIKTVFIYFVIKLIYYIIYLIYAMQTESK